MRKTISKVIVLLTLLLSVDGCAQPIVKVVPEYQGVDIRTKSLVDEFMWLSTQNNIRFYNLVTIGFKKINSGNVVGLCTYGLTWREIDLDIDYWNNSTKSTQMALLFHELTHCYCGRGHDYGKDLPYPETKAGRIARALQWQIEGGPRPGYFEDGCPTTLLYPEVVDDDCVRHHYDEYMKEMFDRCQPF